MHRSHKLTGCSQAVVTTSWDDGHPLDRKLASVLSPFDIKGTFYVAPRSRERPVMSISDLRALSKDFEIGAHTLAHPDLRPLTNEELDNEISGSKSGLESVLGMPVRMFCYPKGKYNRRVLHAVERAGYIGARCTRMFHVVPGKDARRMPVTVQCRPYPMWICLRHCVKTFNWRGFEQLYRMDARATWSQIACAFFEVVLKHGGVWHLYGHSWEIEEFNLWDELRKVLEVVSHHQGAVYLTNSEVIQMTLGREKASLKPR